MEWHGIQILSHWNWSISPKGTQPSREGRFSQLCLPEDKVCLASGMVCRISGVSFVAGSPTALWADFSMEHVANVFSIFVQGRRSSHCERKRGRQPISQVRAEGAAGAGE